MLQRQQTIQTLRNAQFSFCLTLASAYIHTGPLVNSCLLAIYIIQSFRGTTLLDHAGFCKYLLGTKVSAPEPQPVTEEVSK